MATAIHYGGGLLREDLEGLGTRKLSAVNFK